MMLVVCLSKVLANTVKKDDGFVAITLQMPVGRRPGGAEDATFTPNEVAP